MEPVRERLAELAPGAELVENLRFDRRGGQRSGVRRPGRGHRRLRGRRLSAAHRAHASIVGPPRPAVGRAPARSRGRGPCGSAGEAQATLRGPRRRQGQRQARRDRLAARGRRRAGHRGGMCFTFLAAARGNLIGDSLCEEDQIERCREPGRPQADPPSRGHRRLRSLRPGRQLRRAPAGRRWASTSDQAWRPHSPT